VGAQALQGVGYAAGFSYRAVIGGYAMLGMVLILLFLRLSAAVEVPEAVRLGGEQQKKMFLGLHKSQGVIFRLAALFSLDAFAGGLVVQSLVAYWFHLRFGVEPAVLGMIFFRANILQASRQRPGWQSASAVNTMVFTHFPRNFADPGAFHANTAAGDFDAAAALQHLADGCADATIVYHGGSGAG
jgi:hypothetical protein